MLFFITASPTSGSRISYSNTSHVILYLHLLLHLQRLELHSNTSHVILYPSRRRCVCFCFAFKYISCYSLSKVFQNGTYLAQNSNTSHVILYQNLFNVSFVRDAIQIHLMLFFIIIYLSPCAIIQCIQIHLMLFFIKAKGGKPRERGHSNTSHVILYRVSATRISPMW